MNLLLFSWHKKLPCRHPSTLFRSDIVSDVIFFESSKYSIKLVAYSIVSSFFPPLLNQKTFAVSFSDKLVVLAYLTST